MPRKPKPKNATPPPEPDLPPLAIALVTYKRLNEALRTIESTCQNLIYPKELIKWFIGDDGSGDEYTGLLVDKVIGCGQHFWATSGRLRNEGQESTYFCGKVWNMTLGNAHQFSDYVLWLEDDWVLDDSLDLTKYVRLLHKEETVAAMSFRILSIETDVRTKGFNGEMYIEYLRTSQYAYSGNPILRHARMVKHYGWFHEEKDPGNIELDYDDRYRLDEKDGPRIWRPLSISPWGAWKHIGKDKTWK